MVGDGRIDEGLALIEGLPNSLEVAHVRAVAAQGGVVSTQGIQAELEGLLDRVKADDDARKRFLEQLELLDPDDPATGEWRRKLTARLF